MNDVISMADYIQAQDDLDAWATLQAENLENAAEEIYEHEIREEANVDKLDQKPATVLMVVK